METGSERKPWYRRWRYILPLGLLAILLVATFFPPSVPPKSRDQTALDETIGYFVRNYNGTLGLITEHPGSNIYWLASDNYLATLEVERYSTSNQSTLNFAAVLHQAFAGYAATLPQGLTQNQYYALNSSAAYFSCSVDYSLSWGGGGTFGLNGSAVLMTTANNGNPGCASQNYADLLFLQALHYHRIGNAGTASSLYSEGAKDFDGSGFVDRQNNGSALISLGGAEVYQTYKLALYVYATYCLGDQQASTNLATAQSILLHMQDNSTGGFATSYSPNLTSLNAPGLTPSSGVNTETTALAGLAIEQMIQPTASC